MSDSGKKEWQDSYYVCPVCKQPLYPMVNGLLCQQWRAIYPAPQQNNKKGTRASKKVQ